MTSPLSPWNSEDLKSLSTLDDLLTKKASWTSLSTAEAVSLYKTLVWIAGLRKKIEDSQAEIISVREAPAKKAKK